MPEPITITISHRLGRLEARRRIEGGLDHIRGQLGPFTSSIDYTWTGDRLEFSVTAMRQNINGRIDIEDEVVRVELHLPLLLRVLSGKIIDRIRSEGSLLLKGPTQS